MIKMKLLSRHASGVSDGFDISKFPCGETNLRLSQQAVDIISSTKYGDGCVIIGLEWESNDDLITLMLLCDAIDGINPSLSKILSIGYFPYGRQDRRCNPGEPHSLKVIGRIINSLGFERVTVYDPHSDVIEGIIDNIQVITVDQISAHAILNRDYDCLVSPDGGAYKKVTKVAQRTGIPVIRADKVRDTETGRLSEITVHADSGQLNGKRVIIVDDICDGGGTFKGLAHELKMKGAKTVDLFVTHGMFTKGVDAITGDDAIDMILTAFYYGPEEDADKVIDIPEWMMQL